MPFLLDLTSINPVVGGVAVVVFVAFVWYVAQRDPRRKHMPPLVSGPPIIHQSFEHLDPEFPWKLVKWAEEYGPLYRTKAASTNFVWLGSPQIFKEIIDRRSAIYSSRQPLPMSFETASGGRRVTLMPKGDKWRTLRTIMHRVRYCLDEVNCRC
jgi:Cytochrome P450